MVDASARKGVLAVIERIISMLEACTTETPLFPPTELYNEGWLNRLIVDWFSTHPVPSHPLDFSHGAQWFSEALLPSAFLARHRGDPLAESWTHADAVVGHFLIGERGKGDLSLLPSATQFVVVEAKLFSTLSPGVTHARYFDQAARTVACIAEALNRAQRPPSQVEHLGFYVLAPDSQIESAVFAKQMDRGSIQRRVERRVDAYEGAKSDWYAQWFLPTFQHLEIAVISWEDLIARVRHQDPTSAGSLEAFYHRCIEFNKRA
jgi:hypothetical protein